MSRLYTLLTVLLISFIGNAQIGFEKGYYINNEDLKIVCFIRNVEWNNNPESLKYRLSEDGEILDADISGIKEFVIGDRTKFIRRSVNIDQSKTNLDEMSYSIDPVFEEKEVFLEVLFEGVTNLYSYAGGDITRYYFNKDGEPIAPLIYKSYKTSNYEVHKNEGFKFQLWDAMECEAYTIKVLNKLDYYQRDLVDFFIAYHTCVGADYTNYTIKPERDAFHLSIRPGLSQSILEVDQGASRRDNVNFDATLNFTIGVEVEYVLPFNRNKWAVKFEPTYQKFSARDSVVGSSQSRDAVKIDYGFVELATGIRHYMYFNQKSKAFVNASLLYVLGGNSEIIYDPGKDFEIGSNVNYALGMGYKYNNKYSFEFRYFLNRDLLNRFPGINAEFKKISLILGYTIF
ncbi:MAG: tRNA modification GTPase [Leeuwenhoekiella sp.]